MSEYRTAVFRALSDVETALSQTQSLKDQEELKSDQVGRVAQAFDVSQVQYREGLIDLLALLQAQQTLFTVQDQLAQIRLARLRAGVALYKALGGGWTENSVLVQTKESGP